MRQQGLGDGLPSGHAARSPVLSPLRRAQATPLSPAPLQPEAGEMADDAAPAFLPPDDDADDDPDERVEREMGVRQPTVPDPDPEVAARDYLRGRLDEMALHVHALATERGIPIELMDMMELAGTDPIAAETLDELEALDELANEGMPYYGDLLEDLGTDVVDDDEVEDVPGTGTHMLHAAVSSAEVLEHAFMHAMRCSAVQYCACMRAMRCNAVQY